MSKVIRIYLIVVVLLITVFGFLFVKFFAIPEMTSETVTKQYTTISIYAAHEGPYDVIFEVKEDGRKMYLNRGLEKHSLDYFQSHLLDKPANFTVQYYKNREIGRIVSIKCGEIEI